MKAKIIFLGLITLYCSCQEAIRKGRPFPEVNTDSVTVIPTDEEHAEVIKVSDNVKSKVLSSELIEDFYYIPLETTDESLFAFKHTGLFPEQATNWDWFSEKIRNAGRPVKVLNLFAYTGGATLAAAAAGAHVTHVDASKGMVTWAKENAVSSGLGDAPIRWLVDDCVKFVEREIRRGNHYDAIIMDPPSYGRGPKGEIWKIEDAIHPLVKLCTKILSDDPLFFLINSYTTGLAPAVLTYMIATELKKYGGHVDSQEIGLPVSSNGLVLPCGASGRWEK